jgi:hypothetical protein
VDRRILEGNLRRQLKKQSQNIKDEDEDIYQRQDYQRSRQFCEAWWKTRIRVEGN